MANPLAGIETDILDFADRLRNEVVPVVHDGAALIERFSTSAIVQEIAQLAEPLDPEAEQAVVTLIRGMGAAAARIKALTAPQVPSEPDTPAA